jgi:serine/threonine protein kinase/tetratricopeptide (TPR) repeat protein
MLRAEVPSEVRAVRFRGTERFRLIRLLGQGGMGVVYEAEDGELGLRVALKLLPGLQPHLLRRFKKEFRAAANIRHSNVVRFGDLFSDGERWFFTMELVQGSDLCSFLHGLPVALHESILVPPDADGETVRTPRRPFLPSRPGQARPMDQSRLRDAFSQLAQGLAAIHVAGQVHRDIKPSNVLVTPEGRVVILDFGLATGWEVRTTFLGAGTPAYMAPEQSLPDPVSPTADWYSFGVMLYEALTGVLPFDGPSFEILYRKQHEHAVPIRHLVPDVEPALADLCETLLNRAPDGRPDARTILEVLGVPAIPTWGPSQGRASTTPLFGRANPMATLRAAYSDAAAGTCVAVLVSGEPGIGKSELCRQFLEGLGSEQASGIVVASRCHEREFLPFKALDGVIDQLARQVRQLTPEERAALVPSIAPLLRHLFPALEQIPETTLAGAIEIPSDPHELRSRVLDGLRELLAAISGATPLVIFVDDLQWADADSLAMFSALLADSRLPRMLFLGTSREAGGVGTGWLDPAIRQIQVDLPRLDREATLALLQSVFAIDRQSPPELEKLAETTQGNALFIKELARYALAHGLNTSQLQLRDLLRDRVDRAGETARTVLDLVATVGAPVPEAVVQAASNLPPGVFGRTIADLLRERLVHASGALGRERIELCHEQLRVWLWEGMSKPRRRVLAEHLATAFGSEGDPAQVAALWLEAGHNRKAASHLVATGQRAMKSLAFDRAAEHFEMAVKVGNWDTKQKGALLAQLADALAYAGRGSAAAEQYLAAARQGVDQALSLDLHRKASGELLRSGHFDEGMEVARTALAAAGMNMPKHALLSLAWQRLRLRWRGLRCQSGTVGAMSADEAARIDLCWALSSGLGLIDPIQGAYFQTRSLLLALRASDLPRVGRGLAGEAVCCAARGRNGAMRARRLLAKADNIGNTLGDPYVRGVTLLMDGLSRHLIGEFEPSRERLVAAETILTQQCAGAVWELDSARQFLMEDLYYLGDLVSFRRLISTGLRQATERGSLYAATNFRTGLANFVWLMRDDPSRSRRETDEGIQRWSRRGFHVQHWYDLIATVQTELYLGQGLTAYALMRNRWSELRRSGVFHIQHTRIAALHLRARAALAAARQLSGRERATCLDAARRLIATLQRQPDAWAGALALLASSGLTALQGDAAATRKTLAAAIRALQKNDLWLLANAARLAGRSYLADDIPNLTADDARTWMIERGIVNPTAIGHVLAPGLE